MASVKRGSGGFVGPVPKELLDLGRFAGCGKASKTAFTMCGISSVVSHSFLLRFSVGKDLEDLDPEDFSLLSCCVTEGGVDPP